MWSKDDISQGEYSSPKTMLTVLTAQKARQLSEDAEGIGNEIFAQHTSNFLKKVKDAAVLGKRSVEVGVPDFQVREIVLKQLTKLGYTAKIIHGIQQDSDHMKIEW